MWKQAGCDMRDIARRQESEVSPSTKLRVLLRQAQVGEPCRTASLPRESREPNPQHGVEIARHAFGLWIIYPLLLFILHFPVAPIPATAEPVTDLADRGESILFTETFDDLDAWEELTFPKVSQHSSYTVVPDRGDPGSVDGKILKAQSDGSASGILWKGKFNVYEYPGLRWRWKVRNCYEKGDATKKKGDDYPIRLYVMFKYVPSDPAVKTSLKYSLAKLFYGRTPPYTSLNYIWANRDHGMMYMANPYSKKAMMVLLQSGEGKAEQWIQEDINIVKDYLEAFGTSPPAIAGLAIMNDSDNTLESSVSWVDDIEIYRPREPREPNPESRIQNSEDRSQPFDK
jgi:hypothetical protein